jgi:excisionase family DNA binding protein
VSRPYSPASLAEHWGCSSETVRQMCRRGDLSYFRLGKLIRIPANEVERVECLTTDLSGTEGNGALPTGIPASELRLARLYPKEAEPRLSLVKSGDGSTGQPRSE